MADWFRIEADYRAGIKPLRAIAAEHDITEGAFRKRAKRDAWVRNIKAPIIKKVVIDAGEEEQKAGFIYVIYLDDSAGERFYKIGMSASFSQRFSGHQCASPFDIGVACAFFVGDMRATERELHAFYADKRVRGEWFRLSVTDVIEIAAKGVLV